ncbi:MAG: biopolymer transporter ExbD [Pirellulaceae bacterium]|nr:biopolymer transporter ExbD [Pirellulaceae bacterium]MDP7019064.1 biopolymer transporter ExbD [Pirellulaceae bacterium]
MSVKIKKGSAVAMLSLTPLIDVVFLLLIFFLVTTRFAEQDYKVNVKLPTASEAVPLIEEPQQIVIAIDSAGKILVDNKELTPEEVEVLLRQAVANNPTNQTVVIRADREVKLETPIRIMDACLRVGVDYKLSTKGNR